MNRLKELLKTPLIWCFALFILGFTAWDLVTPDKEKSDMENRYLQQKPTLTLKNLFAKGDNAYNQRYEKYINDQFVLRDDWITLKSRAETALGKIENNGLPMARTVISLKRWFRWMRKICKRTSSMSRNFCRCIPSKRLPFASSPTPIPS